MSARATALRAPRLGLSALALAASLSGCRQDIRVASWPADDDAGAADAAVADAGATDAGPTPDCATPWLLVALGGPHGKVLRFTLARDGLPRRCPTDVTAGEALDPSLLDAEMVAPDVLVTVGTASAQAASLSEDRVLWSHPFAVVPATVSEPPRAMVAPFHDGTAPHALVAYGDRSATLTRFFVHDAEGTTHREIAPALVPRSGGEPLWIDLVTVDPVASDHLLVWTNWDVQRVEPHSGVVIDAIELFSYSNTSGNGFTGADAALALTNHSTSVERVWTDGGLQIGEHPTPESCPLRLVDVAPDPFRPGYAYGICNDEPGHRLVHFELSDDLRVAGAEQTFWRSTDDPGFSPTSLGLHVP